MSNINKLPVAELRGIKLQGLNTRDKEKYMIRRKCFFVTPIGGVDTEIRKQFE
jgi:hypothetical protein